MIKKHTKWPRQCNWHCLGHFRHPTHPTSSLLSCRCPQWHSTGRAVGGCHWLPVAAFHQSVVVPVVWCDGVSLSSVVVVVACRCRCRLSLSLSPVVVVVVVACRCRCRCRLSLSLSPVVLSLSFKLSLSIVVVVDNK
jgi:hypothetical protein